MFRIRPRHDADGEIVVGWIPDAEALYLFTGPRLQWPIDAKQLSGMEHPGLSAWILVEEGADSPVGHFDLTVEGSVARLGRVLIDPEQRGRGLAHILTDLAVEQARALGASELRLNVIAGNEPAIRTYRRAGFVELAESERPDVRVMSRPL
ncbi:GNAT family N-acetyltransferase [Microbacterium sp. 22242]|uniref:GNAT family N-acetyltransferase n=1 Tax=Microbacterium sp. 22242 TaxID=3453896 RepID=UPI003F87682D